MTLVLEPSRPGCITDHMYLSITLSQQFSRSPYLSAPIVICQPCAKSGAWAFFCRFFTHSFCRFLLHPPLWWYIRKEEEKGFSDKSGYGGGSLHSEKVLVARCEALKSFEAGRHWTGALMAYQSGSSLAVSRRAGTPLGQTSPRMFAGMYFSSFSKSCSLRDFTAAHPVGKGMDHRPSVVKSNCIPQI